MALSEAESQERISTYYTALMDQVVVRLEAMVPHLEEVRANPAHPNNWQNAELCYLQIRKICEYTALAVLMAHDLYAENPVESLGKKWHAADIFKQILKLNPHAFPAATVVHIDKDGPGQHHVEATKEFLGPEDLAEMYGQCGDRLHVGSIKKLIESRIPPFDLGEIVLWRNRLVQALNTHLVMLPHIGSVLLVTLANAEGNASCVFAKADGPFAIDGDPMVFGL
ncbi:hypothetical protein [Sphingopyxis sp.]|uniref:hypothetical protein n=1 Tax=Sphingopyxis sp. TaxID=1908224 RepID=UPI0035B327D0